MRFWVGITDWDWFRFLRARQPLDEVNFWQPSATRRPVDLERGSLFLFKLHASRGGHIVGGGFFTHYTALPPALTWEAFGEENGAASFDEMLRRIGRYRRRRVDAYADPIGCMVLVEPFFLDDPEWIQGDARAPDPAAITGFAATRSRQAGAALSVIPGGAVNRTAHPLGGRSWTSV